MANAAGGAERSGTGEGRRRRTGGVLCLGHPAQRVHGRVAPVGHDAHALDCLAKGEIVPKVQGMGGEARAEQVDERNLGRS